MNFNSRASSASCPQAGSSYSQFMGLQATGVFNSLAEMEAWTRPRSSVEVCSFPNPAWSGGAKQMPGNRQPLLGGRVSASGYHSEGGEA